MAEKCKIVNQGDGKPYCETHKAALVRQELSGDVNPPGLGHIAAWVCLESGNSHIEGQDL